MFALLFYSKNPTRIANMTKWTGYGCPTEKTQRNAGLPVPAGKYISACFPFGISRFLGFPSSHVT
jgi:hypothetical protein